MRNESLVCDLALSPYSIPTPPSPNMLHTELNIEDSFLTFFDGLDYQYISDNPQKYSMLQSLENNKSALFHFQCNQLPSGSKPNSEQNNIMTFLSKLAENSIHIYSLCPVPSNLSSISIEYLINFCLQKRVQIEKSTWIIHYHNTQTGISKSNMTKALLQIEPNDQDYFCLLCRSLYKINQINHVEFLIDLMTKYPHNTTNLFKTDLIRTHPLLYSIITSSSITDSFFSKVFGQPLLLNQSHLIQLILSHIFKRLPLIPEIESQLFQLMLSNKAILKRTQNIFQILSPHEFGHSLDLSIWIPNIIFKTYPKYDIELIFSHFRRVLPFINLNEVPLLLFNCLLQFEKDKFNLSALVVNLIRSLQLPFKVNEFVHFVYDSIDRNENSVHSLKIFFYELQYQKVITYHDFNKYLHNQGYFQTHQVATLSIISNFPVLIFDFERNIFQNMQYFKAALNDLNRFFNLKEINHQLAEIGQNPMNSQMVKSWPYMVKFYLSIVIIRNQSKYQYKEIINFLNAIGVECLIPELSRNALNLELGNIQSFSVVYSVHHIPQPNQTFKDISGLIHIFNQFSSLCSLTVFDSVFSIQSKGELIRLLSVFFEDLLNFDNATFNHFISFFDCFYSSSKLPNSSSLFVYSFFKTCFDIQNLHSEKIKMFVLKFIDYLFKNSIQKPHNFLNLILKILKAESKTSNGYNFSLFENKFELFEHIFKIVSESISLYPHFDEVADYLSPELATSFSFVIQHESSIQKVVEKIYHNFLLSIKILKLPRFFAQQSLEYSMSIYSLLPNELLSENDIETIRFFKENVSTETFSIWSSWIINRKTIQPIFSPQIQNNEKVENNYFTLLINEISAPILNHFEHHSEKGFLKNIWWILCNNKLFSKLVIQKAIETNIINFDYLHPALLSVDETQFEILCKKYRKTDFVDNDRFLTAVCCSFIIYIYRFRRNYDMIINISNQILEWLQTANKSSNCQLISLLIDTFNFIICWTAEPGKEQWMKDLEIDESFQVMLHKSLYSNLIQLPKEIRRKIVLNMPKCSLKTIKKPLFYAFVLPESTDNSNQFPLPQAFTETVDTGYHNDFEFFDMDSLDWG